MTTPATSPATPFARPIPPVPSRRARRVRRVARAAGFVAGAVAVAGGAFVAVLHYQPAISATVGVAGPKLPVDQPAEPQPPLTNGLSLSERPWARNFDGGKLVSEFKADDYDPQPDGTVNVTHPKTKFYLSRGEYMLLTGDRGEIAFAKPAAGTAGGGMPSAMHAPSSGRLHHVHIERFASPTATRPTLTMDTDNVRFDNDTLRVYTEAIPATPGTPATTTRPAAPATPEVPADRVPVVVHGDDYDMDGTGLTLRWGGDSRLHLLEIAHGHRLTIRHPNALSGGTLADGAERPGRGFLPGVGDPVTDPAAKPPGSDLSLASADPAAAALALPPTTPPTTAAPDPPYRAVFNDDVRVTQGDPDANAAPPARTVAVGDVLTIDFLGGKAATTQPTTQPTTPPAKPAVAMAPPATGAPSRAPAVVTTAAPVATTGPAVAAATTRPKPEAEPITVYWTGKLRVTPLEAAPPMMPLAAGQAAVRLVGGPAVLTYNGAVAKAAVATFRNGDGAVRLDPSAECPTVTVEQPAKGASLECRALSFDPATSVATIFAPANRPATLKVPADRGRAGGPPSVMTATWADRGLLHVVNVGNNPGGVDHVDLIGDVHAADPQFKLDARRLLLDLDLLPPAPRPATRPTTGPTTGPSATTRPDETPPPPREQLRQLTAVGQVACRLLRPGEPDQGIDGDRLVIGLAPTLDGSSAPRTVVADRQPGGPQVRAFDATQAMFADHLEAVLAARPDGAATRPTTNATRATTTATKTATATASTHPADGSDPMAAVALDSLYAAGGVRAVLKNGSTATADTLRETTAADGRQLVELAGRAGARVEDDKHDVLVGSVLHVSPDRGVVVVDGPGTLRTIGHAATRPAATASTATAATATAAGGKDPAAGRPVDVSWTDALTFDGTANTADLVGHVVVHSVDADGTITTVTGDTAHVDLEDAAKATPAAGPSVAARARPAAADGAGAMGQKQVRAMTLSGRVHATSELDVLGTVVRHGELFGDTLIYTAADGLVRVPGRGRMFVENHRLPAAATVDTNAATGAAIPAAARPADGGGNRGAMAVRWRKGMAYDQAGDQITITGNAEVGFQQDTDRATPKSGPKAGPKDGPMQMRSDQLVIHLRKVAVGKTAAGQTAGQTTDPDKVQVADLLAVGGVHFWAKTVDVTCHSATFDPAAGILVARGSDAEPGHATDAGGRGVGSLDGGFDELEFDTAKEEVSHVTGINGTFRR